MTTSIKLSAARSFLKSVQALASDLDEGFEIKIVPKTLDKETGEVMIKLVPTVGTKETKSPKGPKSDESTSSDPYQAKFEKVIDKFDLTKQGMKKSFYGKGITDTEGNKYTIGGLGSKGDNVRLVPVEGTRATKIPLAPFLASLKAKKKPVVKTTGKKATPAPTPKQDTLVEVKSSDLVKGKNLTAAQKASLKESFKVAMKKVKGVTIKDFGKAVTLSKGKGVVVGINVKQKKLRVFVKAEGKFFTTAISK